MRSRQRITQFYWRKEIKMLYFVKWYQVLKLENQCQPWLLHQIYPCLNQKTTKNIGGRISPEWAQNVVCLSTSQLPHPQIVTFCLGGRPTGDNGIWPRLLRSDLNQFGDSRYDPAVQVRTGRGYNSRNTTGCLEITEEDDSIRVFMWQAERPYRNGTISLFKFRILAQGKQMRVQTDSSCSQGWMIMAKIIIIIILSDTEILITRQHYSVIRKHMPFLSH